jgi:cytochrome c oxidase cbb3-type subunit 4
MEIDVNILRSIATVASFAVFIGIWVWAWSKRRSTEFTEAANLPFEQD